MATGDVPLSRPCRVPVALSDWDYFCCPMLLNRAFCSRGHGRRVRTMRPEFAFHSTPAHFVVVPWPFTPVGQEQPLLTDEIGQRAE
jgi:hypothetical protein